MVRQPCLESRNRLRQAWRGLDVDREWKMTVHAPKLLTPEEFASLIEIAITPHNPTLPPHHLSKLIGLGYVLETAKGPIVTGDGLIRITESE